VDGDVLRNGISFDLQKQSKKIIQIKFSQKNILSEFFVPC